ncbi:MAG: HAD family phosphatase [Anaerolineales bacterium]|nr:HAD family phosphatase [Anaerolineales bacterium]
MAIKAVIWDLGGVIVRTEDFTSRERAAQQIGKTRQELEELVFSGESGQQTQLGQQQDDEHWERVRQALQISLEEFPAFQQAFWGGDRLDQGLVDFIRNLRPTYRTGLLSNHFPGLRNTLETKWKIADAFDQIVISAEEGILKPNPRIYQIMIEKLNIFAAEAVFIDDFIHNIHGAQSVGMQAIHFRSPEQAKTELLGLLKFQEQGAGGNAN